MDYPIWINEAEELYKRNKSFTEIGKDLKVNRKLVSFYLKAKGYKPNHKFTPKTKVRQKTQKSINENIFEKVNNSDKAYWLGFLYADGCIRKGTTSDVTIEILGYYDFLIGITKYFNLKGHIYNFKHSDVKRFIISGKDAKRILNHLYKNSSVYLDRKYIKYLELCRSRSTAIEDLE